MQFSVQKNLAASTFRKSLVIFQRIILLWFVLAVIGCTSTQQIKDGVDFKTRCSSPEVIRCVGFDVWEEVDPYVYPPSGQTVKRGSVDQAIKSSGIGSLRFQIPPHSGNDTSGFFMMNFADDFSIQFGEDEEFFIQWRQRFSSELLDTYFDGGLGWKQIIIGEGDRPEFQSPGCNQLQIVVTNTRQRGYPNVFHSCGKFQTIGGGGGYYPDEWMTFQVHIKIGTWYKKDGNYKGDSVVEVWVAREGASSKKIVDRNPEQEKLFGLGVPGSGNGYDLINTNPIAKYGKIWLTPYHTRKSRKQNHPTVYTWYDDLIISRAKIPDPSS